MLKTKINLMVGPWVPFFCTDVVTGTFSARPEIQEVG